MGEGSSFAKLTRAALCVVVAMVLALFPLVLCSCDSPDQKTHVTVSVWDDSRAHLGVRSVR